MNKRSPEYLFKCPEEAIKFGKNFKAIRIAQGFSQEKLALEAGVERSTIVRIENARMNASLDMIFVLAKALNVPTIRLFEY